MRAPPPTIGDELFLKDAANFSLVLGGPLFQLWRRTRLAGDTGQLLRRRVLAIVLLVWAPLLLLSAAEGHAWAGVMMPFLRDIEVHVRLLIAVPLLILAELIVHQRMRPVVGQFLERGLVSEPARPQFDAAIAAAMRLRNSITAETLMIAVVYVVGVGVIWRTTIALDVTSWYAAPADGGLHRSLAGWWFGLVSLPVFQFLLLRWYFRLFIWARFLWQTSRIDLTFVPTHPDRCGGMGFLGQVGYALTPFLLAQGSLLAGTIANQIFYTGATLPEFQVEIAGLVGAMVFAVLGPMLVFGPQLTAAKRKGLREYGTLAQRYGREFDKKWLRGGAPEDEPLIGSSDIQSLSDLVHCVDVVKGMRFAPFSMQTAVHLAVVTVLPLAPLLLTMISMEQLLARLLQIVI